MMPISMISLWNNPYLNVNFIYSDRLFKRKLFLKAITQVLHFVGFLMVGFFHVRSSTDLDKPILRPVLYEVQKKNWKKNKGYLNVK